MVCYTDAAFTAALIFRHGVCRASAPLLLPAAARLLAAMPRDAAGWLPPIIF